MNNIIKNTNNISTHDIQTYTLVITIIYTIIYIVHYIVISINYCRTVYTYNILNGTSDSTVVYDA